MRIIGTTPAVCVSKPSATLDKRAFYDALRPFANKHTSIHFFLRFGGHYELVFDWAHRKPDGSINPLMSAQLIDTHKSGSSKYVVPDLMIDAVRDGTDTDYRLYKRLKAWVDCAISARKNGT